MVNKNALSLAQSVMDAIDGALTVKLKELKPASVTKKWSAWLKKVFDASGVKDAHAHRFRKTFGVDLLIHGAPLEMVSKALGHRNTVITEKFYLRFVPKLQEQLAEHIAKTWQ